MSFISRSRHRLPYGFSTKPMFPPNLMQLNFDAVLSRGYAEAAREVEEEEEVEKIDQTRLPTDYDPATFDPTKHRSPPTERVFKLVDDIAGLTLMEISELGAIMVKRRMKMTEPPTTGVSKGGAAGLAGMAIKALAAAKEEEKKAKRIVSGLKLVSFEAATKIKVLRRLGISLMWALRKRRIRWRRHHLS